MRVLVISAHQNDAGLMCGGTLLKCIKRGDEVYICHLCGDVKSEESNGFHYIGGGFNDGEIFSESDETRHYVAEVIRTVNPDFLITHYPDDASPDNTAVSKLVYDASFCASIPHYPSKIEKPTDVVPIFYMQPQACVGFLPKIYVDITEEFDEKEKLFDCNDTEKMKVFAEFWGLQCSSEYAEAFIQCRASLKMRVQRMLP